MTIKLPPVDQTMLRESSRLDNTARFLRQDADRMQAEARRLRRQHYAENYDRCRACDGHGNVGEGLGIRSCSYCNCGLLPKGYHDQLKKSRQ